MSSSLTGSPNYFNFSVDPMEPNRVWFFSRYSETWRVDCLYPESLMSSSCYDLTADLFESDVAIFNLNSKQSLI